MPTRALLVSVLALAGAAGALAWLSQAQHAAERSTQQAWNINGRIRDLDRLRHMCTAGDAPRAAASEFLAHLAAEAPPRSPTASALTQAAACVSQPDCGTCLPPAVASAESFYADSLTAELRVAQGLQEDGALGMWVLLAALLGLLLAVLAWPHRTTLASAPPPVAAPPPQSDDDQRALEQLLRARLEQLYASRMTALQADRFAYFGEVASGLSHGLKTPLSGIRAAATVAQAKLAADHPAMANIDDIIGEVDALVDQVNRFLAGTRTGAPALVRVPVSALLEGPVGEAEARGKQRGTTMERQHDGADLQVEADAGLIQLALANLVDNAVSASQPGQVVTLQTGAAPPPPRVGTEDSPPSPGTRYVQIAVLDQGPGMPGAVAAGALGSNGGGDGRSGLGVAITRRIVARHGGALVFSRRQGGGTCAAVLLPVAAEGST